MVFIKFIQKYIRVSHLATPVYLIGVFVIIGNLFVSSLYDVPFSGIMLNNEQVELGKNIAKSLSGSLLATANAKEVFPAPVDTEIATVPSLVTEKSAFETENVNREGRLGTPNIRPSTYTVIEGDTLSGIGQKFGLKVASLMYSNNITSEMIKPGQKLKIPAADLTDKQIAKIKADDVKKQSKAVAKSKPKVFLASDEDEASAPQDSSSFVLPIDFYTKVFRGIGRGHKGIDYDAPETSQVLSPCSGVVSDVGPWGKYSGGRGNYVEARCKNGTSVGLFHMSAYSSKAKPGTAVNPGTVLGRVGSTGNSTGSHLHVQFTAAGGGVFDPGLR